MALRPWGRGLRHRAHGMRSAPGDFVIRVELATAAGPLLLVFPQRPSLRCSATISLLLAPRRRRPRAPPVCPIRLTRHGPQRRPARARRRRTSGVFSTIPFTMDPGPSRAVSAPVPAAPVPASAFDFGDFGLPADLAAPRPEPVAPPPQQRRCAGRPSGPWIPGMQDRRRPCHPCRQIHPNPYRPRANAFRPCAGGRLKGCLRPSWRVWASRPRRAFAAQPKRWRPGPPRPVLTEAWSRFLRMRAQEKGRPRGWRNRDRRQHVNPLKFSVTPMMRGGGCCGKGPWLPGPDVPLRRRCRSDGPPQAQLDRRQAALARMVDRFRPRPCSNRGRRRGDAEGAGCGQPPGAAVAALIGPLPRNRQGGEDRFSGRGGGGFQKCI